MNADWDWRIGMLDYETTMRVELWIPSKSKALAGQKVGQHRIKQWWPEPPNARQKARFVKKAMAELTEWANAPIATSLPERSGP